MDPTVPKPAAKVLDLIASKEAPRGYNTLYRNKDREVSYKITQLTIDQVLAKGPLWADQFGSSASGRYQIMAGKNHTLQGLKTELKLRGSQIYNSNLQDRLAYHLLRRRGYDEWIRGKITTDQFMINLAKEWASFPVPYAMRGGKGHMLKRGQSYYDGVGSNSASIGASALWLFLEKVRRDAQRDNETVISPDLPVIDKIDTDPNQGLWEALVAAHNEWLKENRK